MLSLDEMGEATIARLRQLWNGSLPVFSDRTWFPSVPRETVFKRRAQADGFSKHQIDSFMLEEGISI